MFQEALYARLRARLVSNPLKLTDELIEQPALMQDAVEAASDAIQIRDAAKNSLSLEEARARDRFRASVDDNGKAFSDTRITSMIPLDPAVIQATEELEEAKHSAAYWQGLVDSFGDRGSSLRRVAELTVSGYLTPNAAYARPDAAYNENRTEMHKERVKLRQR